MLATATSGHWWSPTCMCSNLVRQRCRRPRIVSHKIETARKASPSGGFVWRRWWEVGDQKAKEKSGQTTRDLLHARYGSSTKAKARVRQQLREDRDQGIHIVRSTPETGNWFLRQGIKDSLQNVVLLVQTILRENIETWTPLMKSIEIASPDALTFSSLFENKNVQRLTWILSH